MYEENLDPRAQSENKLTVRGYDHIPEDYNGMFGVHVSGLTADISETYLLETFQTVGKVHVCKVISVKDSGHPNKEQNYVAFIKYKSKEEAFRALEKFHGFKVQNSTMSVRPAYVSSRFSTERDARHSEEKSRGNMPQSKFTKQKKMNTSGQSTQLRRSPYSTNPKATETSERDRHQSCEDVSTKNVDSSGESTCSQQSISTASSNSKNSTTNKSNEHQDNDHSMDSSGQSTSQQGLSSSSLKASGTNERDQLQDNESNMDSSGQSTCLQQSESSSNLKTITANERSRHQSRDIRSSRDTSGHSSSSQHSTSSSNAKTSKTSERASHQYQDNGGDRNSSGQFTCSKQNTSFSNTRTSATSDRDRHQSQQNGSNKDSSGQSTSSSPKTTATNKKGRHQSRQNGSNRDSSGPRQFTHSHPSPSTVNERGRHQSEANGSCSPKSIDAKYKDIRKQDRNSRGGGTVENCSDRPETMPGIATDYRLREGLLEDKHIASFNSALDKEKPELVADGEEQWLPSETPKSIQPCHDSNNYYYSVSVPEPKRDVHSMQHRTSPLQTSSSYKTTQPNRVPPAMANSGLLYANPSAQAWSQGQLPVQSENLFIHSQTQSTSSGSLPHQQSHVFVAQDVSPSGWTPPTATLPHLGMPRHPFPQTSMPSGFPPCNQSQDASPKGRGQDDVAPLTSTLSQLRMPRSTPPISLPHSSKDLSLWSAQEVADYVRSSECSGYADFFVEQDIDGQALLLLERGMLLHFMKVGPALKLLQVIDRLKKNQATSSFSPDQRNGFSGW